MSALTISNIGLVLLIVPFFVHGIEALFPTQARWVVNWILPFFRPALPTLAAALQREDQLVMMDAARAAAPKDKARAADDYVFLLMFEQRQGAIGFIAAAVGALYGLGLGLTDRDALHVVFGVISILMMLTNANQAGVPVFGHHPRMSRNGKHVGIIFTPFWAVAAVCNWLGVTYALA